MDMSLLANQQKLTFINSVWTLWRSMVKRDRGWERIKEIHAIDTLDDDNDDDI